MMKTFKELTDVTVHSPQTQSHGVKAPNVESRPWIESFPVCPVLNQYQILHLGVQKTTAPTRIIRTKQTTAYFLACIKGKGRVLIDGSWRICRAGYACLLPAYTLNAFEALPGNNWEFCWVCYLRPVEQWPMSGVIAPVMARFDALPLQSAITGLIYECSGPNQPTLMQEWTDLIHAYVLRFIKPSNQPDQLRLLWERVASQISEQWNLAKLAREAGYSNEHLRRLCRRQLGRSPMHQVTYLRMRRAAELLAAELTKRGYVEGVRWLMARGETHCRSYAVNKLAGIDLTKMPTQILQLLMCFQAHDTETIIAERSSDGQTDGFSIHKVRDCKGVQRNAADAMAKRASRLRAEEEAARKERQKKEEAAQMERKQRIAQIQKSRTSHKQCIMCGKPLSLYHRIVFSTKQHNECNKFVE